MSNRRKSSSRRRKSGRIIVGSGQELRLAAQAVLTTIRRIKRKIADEADAAERRRLQRILSRTLRKVRAYREALVELALAVPQLVSRQLVEQISTFALVEDEFTTDARERDN